MMVTADATGDFNATSQILRYSALAREVTVPRIPSVTSTILSGPTPAYSNHHRPGTSSGRTTPSNSHHLAEELDAANVEIARLADDLDILSLQLDEERQRRETAEACWAAGEDRIQALEQEIRDECFEEMATHLETERRRWKAVWDDEADRSDERVDAKIEILARGGGIGICEDEDATTATVTVTALAVGEDGPDLGGRVQQLEYENERMRERIEMMEREKLLRTPTAPSKKQRALKAKKWEAELSFDGNE
jgi:hypothetical protein